MSFQTQTVAEYSAKIAIDPMSITLRLLELEYLLLNLTTLAIIWRDQSWPKPSYKCTFRVPRERQPSFLLQNRRVSLCNLTCSKEIII